MSLELAILGFLNERPRSGYDLKTRCFAGAVSGFWGADQAQIYRTLERLDRGRFVTSKRKRQAGRPDRKIYEITHAGREALAAMVSSAQPLPPTRDAFLLQLYFGHDLDDEGLLNVLRMRRDEHQERLGALRGHAGSLGEDRTLTPRDAVLRHTAIEGAIAQQRAAIDWLDDCIDAAENGALPGSTIDGVGQRHLFTS